MVAGKAAVSGILMVFGRLLARLIDLVTITILARLLQPADFGLVSLAVSLVAVMESAMEIPIAQALVRLPKIEDLHYDTAFTISVVRGLILSLAIFALARPFSTFYADGRLYLLVIALSIAPIARGLVSPRLAHYQKDISFWRDFVLDLGGKCLAFVVAITIALLTDSYWAIAAGVVLFPLFSTLLSYCLAPYRPQFGLRDLGLFAGFIGWMSGAQLVGAVNWQFEKLYLGKVSSKASLGVFTTASDLASVPFLAFFGPLLRPFLAVFSKFLGDTQKLGESYLSASVSVMTIGLPLLVGECLAAAPAVRLVLGDKWSAANPYLALIAISLIPALLALPASSLVMAYGKTRLFFYRNVIEITFKIPLTIFGAIKFGLDGVIFARFTSELVAGIYSMHLVKIITHLSISKQLLANWRPVLSTVGMLPVVWFVEQFLPLNDSTFNAAICLAVISLTGSVAYVICIASLWNLSGRPAGLEAMCDRLVRNRLIKTGLRWTLSHRISK